jgi:hypothetical protein
MNHQSTCRNLRSLFFFHHGKAEFHYVTATKLQEFVTKEKQTKRTAASHTAWSLEHRGLNQLTQPELWPWNALTRNDKRSIATHSIQTQCNVTEYYRPKWRLTARRLCTVSSKSFSPTCVHQCAFIKLELRSELHFTCSKKLDSAVKKRTTLKEAQLKDKWDKETIC